MKLAFNLPSPPKPANEPPYFSTICAISVSNCKIFWRSLTFLLSNVGYNAMQSLEKSINTGRFTPYFASRDFKSPMKLSIFSGAIKIPENARGVIMYGSLGFSASAKTECKLNRSCSSRCSVFISTASDDSNFRVNFFAALLRARSEKSLKIARTTAPLKHSFGAHSTTFPTLAAWRKNRPSIISTEEALFFIASSTADWASDNFLYEAATTEYSGWTNWAFIMTSQIIPKLPWLPINNGVKSNEPSFCLTREIPL